MPGTNTKSARHLFCAECLLESLELLTAACRILRTKCIDHVEANEERCSEHLKGSLEEVTRRASEIGYDNV